MKIHLVNMTKPIYIFLTGSRFFCGHPFLFLINMKMLCLKEIINLIISERTRKHLFKYTMFSSSGHIYLSFLILHPNSHSLSYFLSFILALILYIISHPSSQLSSFNLFFILYLIFSSFILAHIFYLIFHPSSQLSFFILFLILHPSSHPLSYF